MPRYCLDLDAPAAGFIDSFLLGNGWLGATVRGGIGTERFDLNVDTVWSGGPPAADATEGPAHLLPELRAAIRARDYLKADELAKQLQGERWTQSYQPLGGIEFTYSSGSARRYQRRLDLAEAVASSSYDETCLESFVSHPHGVLVAHASGSGILEIGAARIGLSASHPGMQVASIVEGKVHWLLASGRAPANVVPNYIPVSEGAVAYADDTPGQDGTVAVGMGFALVAALVAEPDGGLRLVASAASGHRGHDRRPSADLDALLNEARSRVEAALALPLATLRQRHLEDYRSFFDRVDLDLSGSASPDAAGAELMFHFGRYLMISSSRPGTQASNLQGIWNVDVRPAWSCNYTININTQMNYWPAELAGLPDLHQPMFDLTRDLAHSGALTARRHYGAAGATAHHNADLWRFTAPVPGRTQWSNWPSGLYWMASHLVQHLDFGTASPDFDELYARPVLRACAEFALDMLVEHPDGSLVASPSTSPEHSFVVAGREIAVTAGVAMDQELIREVLQNYVRLADDELAQRARAALERLRLPQIAADGVLLEWDDDKVPAELGHRHLSHLYGLFPGNRITETGTPEAYDAARRALWRRLDAGTGYTGWSQAWVLCIAARLRDGVLAQRSIATLLDELSSRSLLVLHPFDSPEGHVFQIDGNFGVVAGLAELVVQSHEGMIALLKALPPDWTAGRIDSVRCRGGHRVSVTWRNGGLERATIVVAQGGQMTVELPVGEYELAGSDQARLLPVPGAVAGRTRLSWQASGGATYFVTMRD